MIWILAIGSIIALINVVLTYNELLPFFRGLKQLNHFTAVNPSMKNHFFYFFRFCTLIPKLQPLILDVTVAILAGSIGLSGGTYGALIGLSIGFTASLLVKFHRHFIAPKIKVQEINWKAI